MKKLLVVLLALTVMGFAFAQDAAPAPALVWSGSVQTGFQIVGDNVSTRGYLWESNQPSNGSVWIDGTFAGTNAGGKFEIYNKGYDAISADALFGWWKPISMLTLSIGEGYGAGYTTPIEGWGAGGTGFQAKLAPIDGLVISLDYAFSKTTPVAATAPKLDEKPVQIAFSYAAPDLLKIGGNFDIGNKVYIVGLNVTAVKDLTAQVDLKYSDVAGKVTTATTAVEENFAYAMGALKPAIWAAQTNAAKLTWSVKPNVTYTMDSVTPSAYFRYNDDASYSLGAAAAMTVEKNAIYLYADYSSVAATGWDLGLRYIVSF